MDYRKKYSSNRLIINYLCQKLKQSLKRSCIYQHDEADYLPYSNKCKMYDLGFGVEKFYILHRESLWFDSQGKHSL